MSEKILYYLGAGASAKALPVAKSVWQSSIVTKAPIPLIPGLAHELENFDFKDLALLGTGEVVNTRNKLINGLKDTFKRLAAKANEYGDVDTYAKYLNLMEPGCKDFIDLKTTLSQYFALKQVHEIARDYRYFPWLISLLDNKTFPDNVKILSWNYDYQVELAAQRFGISEEISYGSTGAYSHTIGMIPSYPNLHPKFNDFSSLALIHLNGVAGFYTDSASHNGSVFQPSRPMGHEPLLSYITENEIASNMHFAWEGGDYHKKLMANVLNMINGVTILVVIGYSFPFFNRDVDKQILKKLTSYSTLKKIYYQDPILIGEQLRTQFNLPADFNIQHIKQTDSFHIPFEY